MNPGKTPRPGPQAKPIEIDDENSNLNNLDLLTDEEKRNGLSLSILVQLILIALESLDNKKGSSLKEIKKRLLSSGFIDPSTDLRRAMIVGIKQGQITRPSWAVKAGVYGRYIKGDGIPMTIGKQRGKYQLKNIAKVAENKFIGHSSSKTTNQNTSLRSSKRSKSKSKPKSKPKSKSNAKKRIHRGDKKRRSYKSN